MSKVAIAGNASGTGVFTIASPNSNTDRTLTLPDSAGTLLHDSSSLAAANLTGTIAAARLPAGSVLQVVRGTPMTAEFATTSGSYVDVTGLNATITPSSASSKVMVFVFMSDILSSGTGYDTALRIALLRGSTVIQEQVNQLFGFNASAGRVASNTIVFIDSPATTSSTTYKIQLHSRTGSSVSINAYYSQGYSSVMLMEIAG